MRLVFAGTPLFAATQLNALKSRGHEIVLVLTQPDRPSGRGLHAVSSAVKSEAEALGLEVWQPPSVKNDALQVALAKFGVDAWVVAAYGLILPAAILNMPRFGCLNVHASLLPRWRGAAPIQRAIMAGDAKTGITIMRMDEGLDTGPMLLQREIPILEDDNAQSVHDRLAALGAELIVEALDKLESGTLQAEPQPASGVTYAAKLTRADASIDWSQPAHAVAKMIRALDPSPGASTFLRQQSIKLWRSRAHDKDLAEPPGTVLQIDREGIHVACGDGALIVTQLQRAGGKRLSAGDFVRGFALNVGERFGS